MMLERAAEIVAKIQAEGVRATWDSREAANAPVVLVSPPTITPTNRCVADYVWPIYCVAPGRSSDSDTLLVLAPLLAAVFAAGFSGPSRPVVLGTAAGDLPAYQTDFSETM